MNEEQKLGINNLYLTSKLRRSNNRERSCSLLRFLSVEFETKNEGAHLIVKHEGQTVDFWPGTGKFKSRYPGTQYRRGVFNMLKMLGVDTSQAKGQQQ